MTRLRPSLLSLLTALALAGCRPEPVPADYVLFLDLSGSVSAAQRQAWLECAEAVLQRVTFGDSLAIFPVHDRTLDAAPLFRARVPGQGHSLEDLARARAGLRRIRTEASKALRDALTAGTRSRATQLFEVIDKVATVPAGPPPSERVVLIFSDFLHSAADLDMETTPLRSEQVPDLVAAMAQRYGWTADMLRGVTVHGVLSAGDSGGRRPVNDRRLLREFWGALFTGLGGTLATLDTYVSFE